MKQNITRTSPNFVGLLLAACFLVTSFAANAADFSPFQLKIIQPMAGLDERNRFYRAYPGIRYEVQVIGVGGQYPYSYRLVEGPAGMSISASTGVLKWNPPEEGRVRATVEITDQSGRSDSVSWPIAVTKDKFLFVDSENGSPTGRGTMNDPLSSVADIYGGTHYEAKRGGRYQDHFVYFRTGKYVMDGYRVDPRVQWTNSQPVVLMAYPDEAPVLDLSGTYLWADTAVDNFYLEGFSVTEIAANLPNDPDSHKGFRITGTSNNVTFRNNRFNGLAISEDTHQNQSVIMATAADTVGENWGIVGNEFRNIHRAFGIIGYDTSYVAVQGNRFERFTHGKHAIGPKKGTQHWYIRGNRLTDIQGDGIWLYWAHGNTQPYGNMEISFNYVEGSRPVLFNQRLTVTNLPVYIFRNTFVGNVEYRGMVSGSTNQYLHNNIIVNDLAGGAGVSRGILCSNSCSDPGKIALDEENLVYGSAERSAILDANGYVVGSQRDPGLGIVGKFGWEVTGAGPEPAHAPSSGDGSCKGPRVPVIL